MNTPRPLRHGALTNSRPSADVTLIILRVADLAAALRGQRRVLARRGWAGENNSLFAHPAWPVSVVSHLDIRDGYRGQKELFRSLLAPTRQRILRQASIDAGGSSAVRTLSWMRTRANKPCRRCMFFSPPTVPNLLLIVADHHSSCTNLRYLVRMIQFLRGRRSWHGKKFDYC